MKYLILFGFLFLCSCGPAIDQCIWDGRVCVENAAELNLNYILDTFNITEYFYNQTYSESISLYDVADKYPIVVSMSSDLGHNAIGRYFDNDEIKILRGLPYFENYCVLEHEILHYIEYHVLHRSDAQMDAHDYPRMFIKTAHDLSVEWQIGVHMFWNCLQT